jgi:hypothetical protein
MKNIRNPVIIMVFAVFVLIMLFCYCCVHAASSDATGHRSISATHVWDDGGASGQRSKVTFHLAWSAGRECGRMESRTISDMSKAKQSVSWDNMPVTRRGEKVEYYISAEPIDGYSTEVSGNADQGFNVTNHYTGESHKKAVKSVSFSVRAVWKDTLRSDRAGTDNITVWLLANDLKTGNKKELNKKNNWTVEFSNLNLTEKGKSVSYTVMEDVPPGYVCMISGNQEEGFTIMNKSTGD